MSVIAALQKFVVATLKADAGVDALVDGRVYDRPPAGVSMPFVSIGPSEELPFDAECIAMIDAALQIDVWSDKQGGAAEARKICSAIKAALHELDGDLEAGKLLEIRVTQTRAFDDQDPGVTHGIVAIEALLEE
jgi:hypothetical protein